MPSSLTARLETLRSLAVCFKNHPARDNAEKEVARAFAEQFHGALSAAIKRGHGVQVRHEGEAVAQAA